MKLPRFVLCQGNVETLTESGLTAAGAVNESQHCVERISPEHRKS